MNEKVIEKKCKKCKLIQPIREFLTKDSYYFSNTCFNCRKIRIENKRNNLKECKTCKIIKLISEFYYKILGNKKYENSSCKVCENKKAYLRSKEYYAKNKEKINARIRKLYPTRSREWKNRRNYISRKFYERNPEKLLFDAAKKRAKKKFVNFNIELSDIRIPDYCPILGIKLERSKTGHVNDNSPSLDRIIPEKGYIKGNIAVVSHKANRMKDNGSLNEHQKIINYILNNLFIDDYSI